MEHSKVRIGQRVKIVSLDTTHYRYKSDKNMKEMVGRVYTVHSVRPSCFFDAKDTEIMVGILHREAHFEYV